MQNLEIAARKSDFLNLEDSTLLKAKAVKIGGSNYGSE